jgi:hypothetical protein
VPKVKQRFEKVKTRARGPYGLSVPEAGAMIGLGRNASYEAAKRGEIPVLEFNGLKIVPRLPWLRRLGAEDSASVQAMQRKLDQAGKLA